MGREVPIARPEVIGPTDRMSVSADRLNVMGVVHDEGRIDVNAPLVGIMENTEVVTLALKQGTVVVTCHVHRSMEHLGRGSDRNRDGRDVGGTGAQCVEVGI
jgi:hypothetical protein